MATCVDCGGACAQRAERCRPCCNLRLRAAAKDYRCIDCGEPRSKSSYAGRCRKCCYEPRKRRMPDDFAEIAPTMSAEALAKHYQCSTGKITEWFAACGMSRSNATRFMPASGPPEHFARVAAQMTLHEAMAAFDRGETVTKRWYAECGIQPRRKLQILNRAERLGMAPPVVFRDLSRAGQAAEFLRRFGPVYRCNQSGAAETKGQFWSRRGWVLTDAEIIDRAERQGWEPESWRKVA